MQSIELAAILVAPSDFQNFWGGALRAPQEPPGRETTPYWLLRARARPQNRSTAFLQWIMAPSALPPCKDVINLVAVARGIVNMQSIGLAALYGAPSGDLEAPNNFFFSKKLLNLEAFWGARSALTRGGHGTQ